MTRVHGGGQWKGGVYGVVKGGVSIVLANVWWRIWWEHDGVGW